jgi:N-acyl-D-aspartate/D-glutamate deacylase
VLHLSEKSKPNQGQRGVAVNMGGVATNMGGVATDKGGRRNSTLNINELINDK